MRTSILLMLVVLLGAPLDADARRRRPKKKPKPRPAAAAQSSPSDVYDGAFTYSLDVFMVQDKAMGGIRLGGYKGSLGLDLAANLIWLTEDDPNDVVDSFVGALFGLYGYGRVVRTRAAELRIGTGVDIYPLFGINADEVLYSWPVFAEARYWLTTQWGVGAQVRFNLLHSDALEPGVARDGQESIPLMLILTLGGRS
jgi:hypothetical protein